MNLADFQDEIEEVILERGHQYYQEGCVRSLEEIEPNVYQAKVSGSDFYLIQVELDEENNIMASSCSCPYDWGETCKHEAAVYFALQKRLSGGNSPNSRKKAEAASKGSKAVLPKKDLKQILAETSQENLIGFLLTLAGESAEIKARLELAFGGGNEQEEIKRCSKLIRSYLDKNSDRYGFIGYQQMDEALTGVELVLEKSRDALLKGNPLLAVRLALLVMAEVVDLEGDDSDGGVGALMNEGLYLLDEVGEMDDLPAATRESILALILKEAESRRYYGETGWQTDLLSRCVPFAATPEARKRLGDFLQKLLTANQKTDWSSQYRIEDILEIQYSLLVRFESAAQAEFFLNQHLNYGSFRETAIRLAREQGDEERIVRLCLDGEEQDQEKFGLVTRWKEYRYQSYIRTGQLAAQRSLALEFIEGGSFPHYQDLKGTYSAAEWPAVYPAILERLAGQGNRYRSIYTQVLVEEQEWEKLMAYVRTTPSSVDTYYKHLVPEYREEICRIFRSNIKQAAARASTRSHYQVVCAMVRTLKKAGGVKDAREAVRELLLMYPRRPAMRDELGKIKLD
ncbi:SWIM zinc finger family protein [Desulfitobacterium hafniense]|nr:hypothetical protein [Desulfitobacterium hafniense]